MLLQGGFPRQAAETDQEFSDKENALWTHYAVAHPWKDQGDFSEWEDENSTGVSCGSLIHACQVLRWKLLHQIIDMGARCSLQLRCNLCKLK